MFFIRNRKAPRRGSICSGPELPSSKGWEGPSPWGQVGRELPGRRVPLAAVGGASRVPPKRTCRALVGCRCPNKAFFLLKKKNKKLSIQKTKIMASGAISSCKYMGKNWKQWQILFWGAPISLQMMSAAIKLKICLLLGRKAMTNLDSVLKSRDITLPTKPR